MTIIRNVNTHTQMPMIMKLTNAIVKRQIRVESMGTQSCDVQNT